MFFHMNNSFKLEVSTGALPFSQVSKGLKLRVP